MTVRPLNLTAKLRPLPVAHDALFYVNVALLVLFFSLFGSRFVVAPGLEVSLAGRGAAVELPTMAGAVAGARPTDVAITVRSAQAIMVDTGVLRLNELPAWLANQSQLRGRKNLRLLIEGDRSLTEEDLLKITAMATAAGYTIQLAAQPAGGK